MKALFFLLLLLSFATPSFALNTDAAGLDRAAPGTATSTVEQKSVSSPPENIAPVASQESAAPSGECGDDPRFQTINQWLGGPLQTPSLTITPKTFLELDQDLVTSLAGQLIICPNIPLLKSGKTMQKIVVDFDTLWVPLREAAVRGDEAAIQRLYSMFKVAPLSPEKILELVANLNLEEGMVKKLAKGLGIKDLRNILQVYLSFGGKSAQNIRILVAYSSQGHLVTQLPKGSLFLANDKLHNSQETIILLRQAGLTPMTDNEIPK